MDKNMMKTVQEGHLVEIIYLAKDGTISKRKVKVLHIDEDLFQGYCYLRKSTRYFKYDHILALVPVMSNERVIA